MTRNKTVVDTHNMTLDDNEVQANPYNAKKAWHSTPMKRMKSADDSLFYDEQTPQVDKEPENVNHDFEKRWKDLKTYHDKTSKDWKDKFEELQNEMAELKKATPVAPVVPPKSREEIEALKASNPALYAQVEAVAKEVTETDTSKLKEQYAELEKEKLVLAKEKAKKLILEAHPDFSEIVADDAFHAWAATKSQKVQDDIYENPTDGQAAVDALDLYKMFVSKTKQSESKPVQTITLDEDAASLVSTRNTSGAIDSSKKIWSEKEIKRLSLDEYDKYEAEIDLAIKEGRIRK